MSKRFRLAVTFAVAAAIGAPVGGALLAINSNHAESAQPASVQATDQASDYVWNNVGTAMADSRTVSVVNFDNRTLSGTFQVFGNNGATAYLFNGVCHKETPSQRYPGETANAVKCSYQPLHKAKVIVRP